MKYKSEKTLRRAKKAFSLIELMIVIVIIGALTAIILPQFDVSEAEAKDAGCDASNYGTLSQLTKFRSLHGTFPSGMHTGFEDADASKVMGSTETVEGTNDLAVIPSFTYANLDSTNGATEAAELTEGSAASLREAGIVYLCAGGFPNAIASTEDAAALITVPVYEDAKVPSIVDSWYEEWAINATTGKAMEGTLANGSAGAGNEGTPISINGIPLEYYRWDDARTAYEEGSGYTVDEDALVVPLFIAPTTDWNHWYDSNGAENDSKIQVAQVGACPWLEGGVEFRYYIAVFQVFLDGTKAKLLGTMCPEGGSLNP